MDNKRSKVEWSGSGNVEMLKSLLVSFGEESGFVIHPENLSIAGPTYQSFRVLESHTADPRLEFCLLETQTLPAGRVLITLHATPRNKTPDALTPRHLELFKKFALALATRLLTLNIISVTESKSQLGFIKANE